MTTMESSSVIIPVIQLPNIDLDKSHQDGLEDKNSLFNRAAEGNFEIADEVYSAEEMAEFNQQLADEHKGSIMTGFYRQRLEKSNHWNTFYKNNKNNFFKDRHYFHREIPNLIEKYKEHEDYIKLHIKFQRSDLFKVLTQHKTDSEVAHEVAHGVAHGVAHEAVSEATPTDSTDIPTTTVTASSNDNTTIVPTETIPALPNAITIPSEHLGLFHSLFTPSEQLLLQRPYSPLTLAEVGCGVGNTLFPLYEDLPLLSIQGCDISAKAIEIIKESPQYSPKTFNVSVCDISKQLLPFEDNSSEIVTLIFTLSALSPEQFNHTLTECHRILKPGGIFYMRDYAIYDLTMLRFKKGQKLSNESNLFVRGDGTKTFFFDRQNLTNWLTQAGFDVDGDNNVKYIKKTVENRKLELAMERRWIFASATKKIDSKPITPCQCKDHIDRDGVGE
jgi:SAM-dependent methyltransferase